ncbi:MAG TPA: hypothetical protein VKX30_06360 [Flavobacteriaceae bacterium]|nr:hypothetical protein [Flavobacteriaceae bacterium]
MRVKATLLFVVLVSTFGVFNAAAENMQCAELTSLFVEPAKAKNYDAALKHYDALVEACPDYSLAIYQYAERMFKHYIDNGDLDKIKDLEKVYADRMTHFPDRTDRAEQLESIARIQFDNKIGTTESLFEAFDEVYKMDPDRFNSPKSIYIYFSLAVDLFNDGNKELPEVFELYDEVINKIDSQRNEMAETLTALMAKEEAGEDLDSKEARNKKAYETNLNAYGAVTQSINTKLGILADCENLIPLFEKEYEANKDNVEWLKLASNRLDAKECETDLFFKLAERLHEIEPSAQSAYYLARMLEQENKVNQAMEYYNQAADLEVNKVRKARTYFKIAEIHRKRNSKSQARTFYNRNLELNPSNGIAYLRIAALYADSANDCGTTAFEKRAVYWKAAELADRAAAVDVSIASTARATAESYRQRAPSRTDIHNDGMGGKVIQLNCWIGGSITVPQL